MIPTLLVVGVVFGKWWRFAMPLATTGWVVALVATGAGSGITFGLGAGVLALINVTVGVLLFQCARYLFRAARSRT